jgi:hypothetical protein
VRVRVRVRRVLVIDTGVWSAGTTTKVANPLVMWTPNGSTNNHWTITTA